MSRQTGLLVGVIEQMAGPTVLIKGVRNTAPQDPKSIPLQLYGLRPNLLSKG
jgi:hypothetical protein